MAADEDTKMNGPQLEELEVKKVRFLFSTRFVLGVMLFLGFINVYALRVNLSVAIVCMVNHTAVHQLKSQGHHDGPHSHATGGNRSATYLASNMTSLNVSRELATKEPTKSCVLVKGKAAEDGDFVWDKSTQGQILSSFYYGYLVSQVPGGILAERFGGKRVFGGFFSLAVLATFLTPIASRASVVFLIILRILIGIGTGALFPVSVSMVANWAPPLERSKMGGMTLAGAMLGNVVTMPLAGFLCEYGFADGWPSVFYITGILAFVWLVVWMFLVSDYPETHPRISADEKDYIVSSLKGQISSVNQQGSRKTKKPWLAMLKSLPMWAIIVSNTTSDWGLYTFVTNIPTYMYEDLKFDIASNGLFSALPFIGLWLSIQITPPVVDELRSRKLLSTTTARKICGGGGPIGASIFLVALAFMDCTQAMAAVALLTIGVTISGMVLSGYGFNPIDIAPQHSGTIFGISNMVACCSGFLAPTIAAELTRNQSHAEWQRVFFLAAAIYTAGAVFYSVFASGEIQDWAKDDKETKPEETKIPLNTIGGKDEDPAV